MEDSLGLLTSTAIGILRLSQTPIFYIGLTIIYRRHPIRRVSAMAQENNQDYYVYIGTYTHGDSEGIYVYRLDSETGALEYSSKIIGVVNPSFLDIHPRGRYLYSVNEIGEFEGKASGAVTAFYIHQSTGEISFLNQRATGGGAPCHVSVDATGKYLLAANYGGGSVAAFPIGKDGRLGEASDFVQHTGSSVNPRRQSEPHAHSIMIDPENRFAFAPDLGLDKILIYKLNLEDGSLTANAQPWARVHPGAGPRHLDFHPNGKYAYVINELDSTFTAFRYDANIGTLTEIQTISTLPEDFDGTSHCADVHVHPSGKFLYGSNRGHDSIVICAIDPETGMLSYIGCESTQGQAPRNFGLNPEGTFLLAANQSTNTIVTFAVDADTGELTATGNVLEVPTPVCLKMLACSA